MMAGKGRRKADQSLIEWDWESVRKAAVAAVASVARLDLGGLFRPCSPPESLLQCFAHMVSYYPCLFSCESSCGRLKLVEINEGRKGVRRFLGGRGREGSNRIEVP